VHLEQVVWSWGRLARAAIQQWPGHGRTDRRRVSIEVRAKEQGRSF
jgi:hypothetical protein